MKLDNFVPFGRPQSSTLITQLITKLDVSNKLIPEQKYQTHLESKQMRLFLRLICLFLFLLLYVPCQQLWSLRDGQFT